MYCIHCGADGAATFCAVCGRRQQDEIQQSGSSGSALVDTPDPKAQNRSQVEESSIAWMHSIQYETVLANSDARRRIAAAGQGASKGVTGDDLLAIFDAVSPIGFSLEKLTNVILPIYDRLGIKTDSEAQVVFDAPPGRVILAVLCTLAAKSLAIADVCQDDTRCSVSAVIPWGLMTNRGRMHVTVSLEEQGVRVSIAVTISGQWYDFGKSKGMIDGMFAAIQSDLMSQQSGHPVNAQRVA